MWRRRRRPGGQLAQSHGAVEGLVAHGQRGHGAAGGRGRGGRARRSDERAPLASDRHCPRRALHPHTFFSVFLRCAGGGGASGAGQSRPPPSASLPRLLPRALLFTCRILKGFSAYRYGFFSARPVRALHTGRGGRGWPGRPGRPGSTPLCHTRRSTSKLMKWLLRNRSRSRKKIPNFSSTDILEFEMKRFVDLFRRERP